MRDFFKRWRRKVGCVTLVMALICMVGWVRSLAVADVTFLSKDKFKVGRLVSTNSRLIWERYRSDLPMAISPLNDISCVYEDFKIVSEMPVFYNFDFVEWDFRCCGFGVAEVQLKYPPGIQLKIVTVPYWSIVIPLTLLSGVLLLTKPRSSKTNKSDEPIAEKVA